jgi:tetratricopeptide (TPR) repeat protein
MVGDLKEKVVLLLIVVTLLCTPALGQTTAIDWDNTGAALEAQGKYSEAIGAYNKAIDINPEDEIAWNNKISALKKLGRTEEANAAYAELEELKADSSTTILDHGMASGVDESTNRVTNRTQEFSANDSKAYSWLSLKNVQGACTLHWYWYSPAGDMLYTDNVQVPMPTGGDRWSTYNASSNIDIAGNDPANLLGDWHVDVYLNGQKILTEEFSISSDQTPISKTDQLAKSAIEQTTAEYHLYQSDQGKYDAAMNKGQNLYYQGKYAEAAVAYEEAIRLALNNFQVWQAWNGKGNSLSKQGKYQEAIQAYDEAIQILPDNSMVWSNKGDALKAMGRNDESNVAYATAKGLGFGNSTWMPEINATGFNLSSIYAIQILDHSMASDVDEYTNNVVTRANTFSSADRKVYSWLSLGHVLEGSVVWHWYSPDGNPYQTGQVDIPRNQSGGYWSSYNVWYPLDIASIPNESYLSGNWHVDIYINGQKRLTEQFNLKLGSGTSKAPSASPSSSTTPGQNAAHGTITVLDHCMASKIDEPTQMPVTTTKTDEFKDYMTANSWLQLGNIGVARVDWHWYNGGGWDIKDSYNIPPNPNGGYYSSYNVWDPLDISSLALSYRQGESDAAQSCESAQLYAERQGWASASCHTNNVADPYGDWTVDVYVNDKWILQEQFTVVSG